MAPKSDFEMIVRIADAMGFDVRGLVPFGRGESADMGQSRGAQSGEADRHTRMARSAMDWNRS
jgi:NADH-quinone oxidoreductase subunit G